MILNDRQRRVFAKAIATANTALVKVEYLSGLAAAVPEFQTQAQQVKDKRDFVHHFAETALELDRQMSQG